MKRVLVLFLVFTLVGCDASGDRVLVGKFLYDTGLTPPRRYDVVVFKYPAMPVENGTPKNYIKRLLGLPGELLAIFFGGLYLFHLGDWLADNLNDDELRELGKTREQLRAMADKVPELMKDKDWAKLGITRDEWLELADASRDKPVNELDLWQRPQKDHATARKLWDLGRFKILRKPPAVMLALSRTVFDNDFLAKDLVGVLPERWAPETGTRWSVLSNTDSSAPLQRNFQSPGTAKGEEWLRYRHIVRSRTWKHDTKYWPELITDFLGYNSFVTSTHSHPAPNWVGDLMLECKLTVEEPKGEFWMELSRGVDRFQARFDLATGVCTLYRNSEHKTTAKNVLDWQPLGSAQTRVKAKGEYMLRFANYDQRLTVWVGRDLPFDDGKDYPPPAKPGPDSEDGDPQTLEKIRNNDLQPASLCSVGAAVQVHNLKLWRDTYYTGSPQSSDAGGAVKGEDWKNPARWDALRDVKIMRPHTIYVWPGHYLCLGDNSPESSDSRQWGLVPDRLMLGRALVVYFPFDRAGTIK
jgi:signal peptidase I